MTWWRFTTALAASSLEALAAARAVRGDWPLALALHAASSGCAAASLHRRLVHGPAGWSFALVFAAALLLPALGPLGLAGLAFAAPRAEQPSEPDLVRTPVPAPPEPPAGADPPHAGSAPSRTGREARLSALAEARGRSHPTAVARLRRALGDPDEEVRLLAHAILESKSRTAYRRIQLAERELESTPPSRRAGLQRQLAMEHWELAWLGLVEGECLDEALGAARRHAHAALERETRSASLHFLLGRIALRRGDSREAESELLKASGLGLPATLAAPYLAEAAFIARRFDLVRRGLTGADGGSETVERLRRYWA
jgi:polysaccharide biosynthesis protein PelE